jgi:parallel beta-helix repeat protein/predicted outer membrane repeat protein
MNKTILQKLTLALLIGFVSSAVNSLGSEGISPIADAGLPRYAAQDPVVLDGIGSFDPDNSGSLSYTWRQISGPTVVITDANTANPTISGFNQTDRIQECEFELVVSDGELASLPDTIKVIIVPDFGQNFMRHVNPPFDPQKPTLIFFGGGDCVNGVSGFKISLPTLLDKTNAIDFPDGYKPDKKSGADWRTYYGCGDMIIVYLSSVAPYYKMPIHIVGASTGGQPAVDVGIRFNKSYRDARYAVNRVTLEDASTYCRGSKGYSESVAAFVTSSVDGEQCWLDNYVSKDADFYPNVLNVGFDLVDHDLAPWWYHYSFTIDESNYFNNGVIAGAYWSIVGPGKNLQLAAKNADQAYRFKWYGKSWTGYMDFWNEPNYPGKLPEPVTLVGPEDGAFVDANGAIFSCEESENAVGYQLLFGPDPHRVMDYYIVSDTPIPPTEVITSSAFEQTWWTVKAYDQYGSTIYADPIRANFEHLGPPIIENITTGQRYASVRCAIDEALQKHEIVVSPGVYKDDIDFQGKNLTLRSKDPNDPVIMATTVVEGYGNESVVTFSGGEDASCILAGFTITGGKRGIYCSGSSPTITNCMVIGNGITDVGGGMYIENDSNPTLVNCTFSSNSSSMVGGGIQNVNSNPILINCTFTGNSAAYFGGGIYCAGGNPILTNCILWDNTPDEIYIYDGTPVITYSNIQGGTTGEGNIDTDPLFANAPNGDYHLKSQAGRWDPVSQNWILDDVTSPCIDSGDPNNPVSAEPLPNGDIINMGAYGGTIEASKSP